MNAAVTMARWPRRDPVGGAQAWLTPVAEPADHRLILFPHAGAGAAAYVPLARAFAGTGVVVSIVRYPGRETRLLEPMPQSVATLAALLANELEPLQCGKFAFFGHSFGALVAFELAYLWRHSGSAPTRLWLSGRPAPQVPAVKPLLHALPDPEFLDAVRRRYDALPAEALEHPELLDLLLPALRADFRCAETYQCSQRPPLSVPFTICRGRDDRWVDDRAAAGWSQHTTGPVSEQVFAGGHRYLASAQDEVRAHVLQRLQGEGCSQ